MPNPKPFVLDCSSIREVADALKIFPFVSTNMVDLQPSDIISIVQNIHFMKITHVGADLYNHDGRGRPFHIFKNEELNPVTNQQAKYLLEREY